MPRDTHLFTLSNPNFVLRKKKRLSRKTLSNLASEYGESCGLLSLPWRARISLLEKAGGAWRCVEGLSGFLTSPSFRASTGSGTMGSAWPVVVLAFPGLFLSGVVAGGGDQVSVGNHGQGIFGTGHPAAGH